MTDYDTYILFGAVYDSQEVAEMDYEAVKALYYDWQLIDNFDAAIVAKRDDGKVKIVKKHEQPTRKGGWRGAGRRGCVGRSGGAASRRRVGCPVRSLRSVRRRPRASRRRSWRASTPSS